MTEPTTSAIATSDPAALLDQKTLFSSVTLACMVALAAMHLVDGATVAEFVKWLAASYLGAGALTSAAQKIALASAAQSADSPATHHAIVQAIRK